MEEVPLERGEVVRVRGKELDEADVLVEDGGLAAAVAQGALAEAANDEEAALVHDGNVARAPEVGDLLAGAAALGGQRAKAPPARRRGGAELAEAGRARHARDPREAHPGERASAAIAAAGEALVVVRPGPVRIQVELGKVERKFGRHVVAVDRTAKGTQGIQSPTVRIVVVVVVIVAVVVVPEVG